MRPRPHNKTRHAFDTPSCSAFETGGQEIPNKLVHPLEFPSPSEGEGHTSAYYWATSQSQLLTPVSLTFAKDVETNIANHLAQLKLERDFDSVPL